MANAPLLAKEASTKDKIKLLAVHAPESSEAVAALLEVSPSEALEFLAQHGAEINAEHLRVELTGEALPILARRHAVRTIKRFDADFDQLDTMEVADLLKHALRIIENDDRGQIAQKDPFANYTPVSITFINGGGMQIDAARTFDVETVEVLK